MKGYLNFAISTLISLTAVIIKPNILDCECQIWRLPDSNIDYSDGTLLNADPCLCFHVFQVKQTETIDLGFNRQIWVSLHEFKNRWNSCFTTDSALLRQKTPICFLYCILWRIPIVISRHLSYEQYGIAHVYYQL